jgi:hypothetical protein
MVHVDERGTRVRHHLHMVVDLGRA